MVAAQSFSHSALLRSDAAAVEQQKDGSPSADNHTAAGMLLVTTSQSVSGMDVTTAAGQDEVNRL